MRKKVDCSIKSLILLALTLLSLTVITLPAVLAAGITLDGVVDESDWILWFEDTSQSPMFNVSWHEDSTNLYIAIVTDDTNVNDDLLQFAFQAVGVDYLIEIKPGYWVKYRESGGSWEGYWKNAKDGLPTGVMAKAGTTDGKRSYEISIDLSILGGKATDFPDNFDAWIKVVDGNPEGPTNYYPDSLSGWWWELETLRKPDEENGKTKNNHETPEFVVPELPIGTIIALLASFAALTLYALKRPTTIK